MGKICQVEGCTEDLEALGRPYFIKKKICEQHMRAEVVERSCGGAKLWRFCQQCGKLEPLTCFDGRKRNCRNSLRKRRSPTDKLQDSENVHTDQDCSNAHRQGHYCSDPTDQSAEHAMHGYAGSMSDASAGSYSLTATAVEDANSQQLHKMECSIGAAAAVAAAATAGGAMYQPPSLDMAWMQIQQQQQQQQVELLPGLHIDGCWGFDVAPLSTQLSTAVTCHGRCHQAPMMTAGIGLGLPNHSLASSMTAAADSGTNSNNNTGKVSDMDLEAVMMQELLTLLNEGCVPPVNSNQQLPALLPSQQQVLLFTATGQAAAAQSASGLTAMTRLSHEPLMHQMSVNIPAVGCRCPTAIPTAATAAQCQLSCSAATAMPAGMAPLVTAGSGGSSSSGIAGGFYSLAGAAAAAAPAVSQQCALPAMSTQQQQQQQQQRRAQMASRLQMLTARVTEMQNMLMHLQQSVATPAMHA